MHYVPIYLNNFVDTAKRCIAGVIKALADDKKIDIFYKHIMLSHIYYPEELVEFDSEGDDDYDDEERKVEVVNLL